MEDVIEGRWCVPRNPAAAQEGAIFHDATARRLGYESGLVPGAVHLEQFVPMLVRHFGEDWWRHGTLSLYVVSVTVDHEAVCCYLEPLSRERALVWMNAEGEALILEGTASLGPDPGSETVKRLHEAQAPRALRMLAGVEVGAIVRDAPTRIPAAEVDEHLSVITEPMSCYRRPLYGERVAPLAAAVDAMRVVEPGLAPVDVPYVSMEGALEIRHLNGPVFCDHDYLVEGRVLGLSEDPRAEVLWYQADLCEPEDHHPVARMIRMERLFKESLPQRASSAPA